MEAGQEEHTFSKGGMKAVQGFLSRHMVEDGEPRAKSEPPKDANEEIVPAPDSEIKAERVPITKTSPW